MKNQLINLSILRIHLCFMMFLPLFLIYACQNKSESSLPGGETGEDKFVLDTTSIKNFEIGSSIRALFPVDDQTVWFGGSGGKFGYTEDGGATWHIDSIVHPDQAKLEFRSIAIVKNNVFLLSVASPALLFKSPDKGKSWELVYRENDSLAFYDAMAFWDEKEGIAMGDPTDGCLSIIKTMDGGLSWTKITCDILPETVEGEAAFAASNSNIALYENHVWMVTGGQRARVFHSSDRGTNWEVNNTPIIQGGQMTGIFSCDFYNENTGIIFGGNWNEKDKNTGNKAITHDGGRTWSLIADGHPPGYQSCVQYIGDNSPDEILSAGIPGIAYSRDGGNTWNQITDQSFYTFRKADKVIWLAGSNKIASWQIKI